MRLFVAVNFEDSLKDALADTAARLKQEAGSGNFTRRDNFHLTLAFLGEVPGARISAVKRAMDAVLFEPFSLSFEQLGEFKRSGGGIWWIGAAQYPPLLKMQADLSAALRREGFPLESRPFRPHLTLGREVTLPPSFDSNPFRSPFIARHVRQKKRVNVPDSPWPLEVIRPSGGSLRRAKRASG